MECNRACPLSPTYPTPREETPTDCGVHTTLLRQPKGDSIRLEEISNDPESSQIESNEALSKTYEDTHHDRPHVAHSATRKSFILHPSMWMWEILWLVFATSILVTMIAILAAFDGKPSPVVGGLTLNTIVAIAATVFRICLMVPMSVCICQSTWIWLQKGFRPLRDVVKFDTASRGPLGSLQLLWHVGFSPSISLASFLVVSAIAIAPFFQQSVTFHTAGVPSSGSSQESRHAFASSAFTYNGSIGNVGNSYAAYGNDIPYNLKSAINTGLHSSGMVAMPQPPYSCPTGNCTWDPFPTLAVSAQCFDDAPRFSLNCSETDFTTWPGNPFKSCTMVTSGADRVTLPPNTVYESVSTFGLSPPQDAGPPFNYYNFDHGQPTRPQDNLDVR